MATKHSLSEQGMEKLIADFEKIENHTFWSFDTMDAYVMYKHPEQLDEWLDIAFSVPKTKDCNGAERSDIKEVRRIFVEKYFPEHTEEAIKARKEAEKAKRKADKEAKKAEEASKSATEKRKMQLERILNKANKKAEEAKD